MQPDKVIKIGKYLLHEHHYSEAYHQAGHAAGIYLNSKMNNLHPGSFHVVKVLKDNDQLVVTSDFKLKVKGGRLLEALSAPNPDWFKKQQINIDSWETSNRRRMQALETDIVNLLLGPIAEAKYIAECDDELFNSKLVNLNALQYYGGSLDLSLANEYLEYLIPQAMGRDKKLSELFEKAFDFINDYSNWQAISRLAKYILKQNKSIIEYGEIVAVLEESKNEYVNSFTGT